MIFWGSEQEYGLSRRGFGWVVGASGIWARFISPAVRHHVSLLSDVAFVCCRVRRKVV